MEATAPNSDTAKRPRDEAPDKEAVAPSAKEQPRKKARREEKCSKCKTRLARRGMVMQYIMDYNCLSDISDSQS